MNTYEKGYSTLNPKQREAVDTIYGPVLVIAWPGSGKTQLLAARIAHILTETDALPSNILCLTFTENAAKNMRTRLARMIGPDAYRVAIHTFHSFGNEILNRYKYMFKEYEDAGTIDDIIASQILDEILAPLAWDDPYKPGMRASDTIREILSAIANLKKWGVTPTLYRLILEKNRRDLDLLTPLLQKYFSEIDTLWQKKDEKIKKIEIFRELTNMVQQLIISQDPIGGYDTLLRTISLSLEASWENYDGDHSTKFLTTWKDAWTTKNYTGDRIWKESLKHTKQLSLANIYESYQWTLEERGYIDFSDMILRAIELVERDPSIQANLAEQYQFILIDEYQDTNEAQMRLVHSILSVGNDDPNIFAVGDDDQSIYKFQWANIKNIRDFHDAWSETKLVILDTNYRSNSEIIESSRAVIVSEMSDIGNIFPGSKKEFTSASGPGGHIGKYIFQNEIEESSWIVSDIVRKIGAGVSPESIAVITKKNKSLELIGKGLLDKNIHVSMSRGESLWENELIILVTQLLEYLASLTTHTEARETLVNVISHPCWNIPRLTLWQISRDIYHARKEENKSWIYQLSQSEVSEVRDLANFLKELSNQSEYRRLEDLIDLITGANSLSLPEDHNEDGLIDQLQIDMLGGERKNYVSPLYSYFFDQLWNHKWEIEKSRALTNIKKLIDHIRSYKSKKPYITLADAIEFLALIKTYDIRIETSHLIGNEQNAVNLITVHKAKGLEWDHVYVPSVHKREYKLGKITGSTLPKNLPLEADKDDDEDIERLIYTAYTRARTNLTITYARVDRDERTNDPLPCIELENTDWQEISIAPDTLIPLLEVQKKDLFSLPYLGEEKSFLSERIEKNFVMSATALQNFLNIVDAGPEYFISNNILRFPQAKNIAASYGSAMHQALEDFFSDFKTHKTFKKEILSDSFKKSFEKEGYEKSKENEWIARGLTNLESLYTEITGHDYGELLLEKDFRTDGGGVFLGDIQITGKIDRIEILPDGNLIVTDYKTGGGFDTFDGRGGEYMKLKQWKYRLQLAFYAILFELSPRFRMYPARRYELFFIEKNADEDRFHRVTEYIHEGEIERTKALIRAVSRCISTLEFPDISQYEPSIEWIRQFEEDLIGWV